MLKPGNVFALSRGGYTRGASLTMRCIAGQDSQRISKLTDIIAKGSLVSFPHEDCNGEVQHALRLVRMVKPMTRFVSRPRIWKGACPSMWEDWIAAKAFLKARWQPLY